jgi:hypothetical protein
LFVAVLVPGVKTDLFTVQIVHNGFFCGLRGNLQYIDATYTQSDNCEAATWSMSELNELLHILGCERNGKLQTYWVLPDKELGEGLVILEKLSDIRAMINASRTEKTLSVFVDHSNFVLGLRDDIYVRPLDKIARAEEQARAA